MTPVKKINNNNNFTFHRNNVYFVYNEIFTFTS